MIYKLIVIDVDGTIAEPNKPVELEVAIKLQDLERKGLRLVFASGKSSWYLSGLARGLGIKHPLVVGENGCVIFDPLELKEIKLASRPLGIVQIENRIIERYGDHVFLQPNQVELTIFPKKTIQIAEITSYIREIIKPYKNELIIYEHQDAIDVLPSNVNKGKALSWIKDMLHVKKEEILALGDSENDIPMFREAGLSLVIGSTITEYKEGRCFNNIKEAIEFLGEIV